MIIEIEGPKIGTEMFNSQYSIMIKWMSVDTQKSVYALYQLGFKRV